MAAAYASRLVISLRCLCAAIMRATRPNPASSGKVPAEASYREQRGIGNRGRSPCGARHRRTRPARDGGVVARAKAQNQNSNSNQWLRPAGEKLAAQGANAVVLMGTPLDHAKVQMVSVTIRTSCQGCIGDSSGSPPTIRTKVYATTLSPKWPSSFVRHLFDTSAPGCFLKMLNIA
jgi:hypothetical protein